MARAGTVYGMGALADLGLTTDDGPIVVICAPDSVLAEAGAMTPRPAFASTLLTADPAARIVWWPERRHLKPGTLARLAWLADAAGGRTWLIIDPAEDESPGVAELSIALERAGLRMVEERGLGRGETAVRVAAAE